MLKLASDIEFALQIEKDLVTTVRVQIDSIELYRSVSPSEKECLEKTQSNASLK